MGWDNNKPNKSTRPTLTTMSYRGRMGGWAGTITNQTRAHARHIQLWVTGEGWEDGLGQKQAKQEHTPDTYNYELQGKDGRMGWDNNKPNKSTRPTLTTMSYRGRMGGWAGTITNQTRAHARHLQLWVTGEGWEDGLGQWQTKQEHTPDTYNYELQGKDGRMGWGNNKPNKSTRPTLTTMSYRGRMGGWAGTMTNQTRAQARHLQLWVRGDGWEDGLRQWQTKQEHTPDTYNYELEGKDGRMGWDNDKPC